MTSDKIKEIIELNTHGIYLMRTHRTSAADLDQILTMLREKFPRTTYPHLHFIVVNDESTDLTELLDSELATFGLMRIPSA